MDILSPLSFSLMNENVVDEDKLMAAVEFSCVALERKPSNTSSRGRCSVTRPK